MSRWTALCMAALAVGGGCKEGKKSRPKVEPAHAEPDAALAGPERIVISGVVIKEISPSSGPEREIYARELAKALGDQLGASEWFVLEPETPPEGVRGRRAALEVAIGYDVLPEGSTGTPAVIAVVEAAFKWEGRERDATPEMNMVAERPLRPGEDKELDGIIAAHCERAMKDAGEGLIRKESLRVGPEEGVVAAVADEELDIRLWALFLVGERRIGAAYDATVRRLKGAQDEEERDAAIGALVALGDRRAVHELTNLADFQDYALMRRILDAVAAIGGEEAAEYLEFVASGHPDSQLRGQATQALDRLRRK